jgi:Nuclease-related domain
MSENEPSAREGEASSFGVPGRSAQREYDRRRGRERDRIRQRRGIAVSLVLVAAVAGYVAVQVMAALVNEYLGRHTSGFSRHPFSASSAHEIGLLIAFVAAVGMARTILMPRQSTTSWRSGAGGERSVGARLASVSSKGVTVVHDRRIPGSRANIDHIAVGPGGVFVIDAKVCKGRATSRTTGPIWNRGPVKLFVGGRDRSSDVEGMGRQEEAVRIALRSAGIEVSIQSLVVLVGAEWGWFARPMKIQGVLICWPKELARYVSRPGPFGADQVQRITRAIATLLPEA